MKINRNIMAKEFFCRKQIFVILLASIFVFFGTKIYPEENLSVSKSSNMVYQFINDHEYLFVPFSDAVAGLSLCGPWCGLAGGVAGAADEGLIYYGYTDKRYLTYGILGGATGNMFSPAITYTGVLTGVFFTGVFDEHKELVAPAFMATLGTQAAGVSGLMLSGAGSIIDSALSVSNATAKYPITSFILVPKFLNTILGPGIATLVTVYLNAVIYSEQTLPEILKSEAFTNTAVMVPMWEMMKNYTRVAMKLYDNYDKFIPQEEFKEHLEKNVITLIGGQLLIRWLVVKKILLNQNLEYHFNHLDQPRVGEVSGNQFLSQGIKIAVFIIPWVVGQAMTNSVERYYDDRLSITLKDNLQKKLFSQENLLRLSNHGNFSVYMDNLNLDTATISNLGSSLFSGAVSTSVSGAYGTSLIVIHSRSILLYTFLYQMVSGLIMQHLAAQNIAYDEELKFLNSELLDLYKDTKEHVRTITERDGITTIGNRAQELSTALIETEGKRNLWYIALQLYFKADKVLGTIFNYYLVGKEVQQGKLSFENRNLLRKAVMDESNMFSWGDRNLLTVGQVEKSLDRLIILEGIIDLPLSSGDKINRITQDGNQLILHNLEVGVGDRVLVTVDDLKFTMGKVYAITGDTGCGKTSLLSKIKGIKEGVYGKGDIYYPKINSKDPKIVMLSQQDYFPLNSTLQGVLAYPDKLSDDPELNNEQRKEMVMLLREMGLYQFTTPALNLDSKKNWYRFLSGGEKKKILIISAILKFKNKEPGILILDEIFNGLDLDSIKTVQGVLKKYLPDALILVVDHHAAANNFNFYDDEIHFTDKRLILLSLSSGKNVNFPRPC